MASRWWAQVLASLLCVGLAFGAFGPSPLLSAALLIGALVFAAGAFKSMKGQVAPGWRVAILAVVGLASAVVIVLLVAALPVPDIG